jgi:hypothetical protein
MTLAELISKHKILQNVECGVYIGDGWTDIVDNLCKEIEVYGQLKNIEFVVGQVKEKFGTLRVYVDNADDAVDTFVDDAERLSESTCETCGEPGALRGNSWLYTACETCYVARKQHVQL